MSSPFPWRPEARQRVAWHRRSVGHGQPIRRRGARAFPVFSGRRISVDIRLLQRRKFVDRAKNSVDRPSNEFDTQVLELSLYSLPTSTPKRQHRRFWGSFFSVSVFPTRHWHGTVQRSLRLGSWLHPTFLAAGLNIGTRLLSLVGDDAVLSERADQLVAVATEQRFPYQCHLYPGDGV
jgi:hypothetical protein